MEKGNQVWGNDWRAKIVSRIRAAGYDTMSDFLTRFPADPYVKLAERLGDEVAALQLEWLQFDEARNENQVRMAAMDSLTREINFHLPNGWRHEAKDDFKTASAFVDWMVRVEQKQADLKLVARAVWDSLEELHPPYGWMPSGPSDPFIEKAFSKGWP